MNAVFSGSLRVSHGGGSKHLPLREPLQIDRVGALKMREETRGDIGGDTSCERVIANHSDCEGGMGTEPMLRRLVWPWSSVCFGCEDVDEYFSRPPDKRLRKVTVAQVAEIRARVAAGELQKDVAKDYGITPTNVNKIVKNRAWVRK